MGANRISGPPYLEHDLEQDRLVYIKELVEHRIVRVDGILEVGLYMDRHVLVGLNINNWSSVFRFLQRGLLKQSPSHAGITLVDVVNTSRELIEISKVVLNFIPKKTLGAPCKEQVSCLEGYKLAFEFSKQERVIIPKTAWPCQ